MNIQADSVSFGKLLERAAPKVKSEATDVRVFRVKNLLCKTRKGTDKQ